MPTLKPYSAEFKNKLRLVFDGLEDHVIKKFEEIRDRINDASDEEHTHQDDTEGGKLDHNLALENFDGGQAGQYNHLTDAELDDVQVDIGLNNTHRASNGNDHSNVVLNNTHRTSNGSDHSYINQSVTTTSSPTFVGVQSVGDLDITCGANKTLELQTAVYKDENVGALTLSLPVGTQPDEVEITDENGDGTGIYTWGFAVDELVSGVYEVQHDYKEGTDLTFHVHWGANAAPTGTDYVKWELTYTIVRDSNTVNAVTTINVETAYDTQYEWVRSDFTAITGSTGGIDGGNIKIGDQFFFKLKRVTATGDAYAGDALVATIGMHYQVDTMGSRQIGTK